MALPILPEHAHLSAFAEDFGEGPCGGIADDVVHQSIEVAADAGASECEKGEDDDQPAFHLTRAEVLDQRDPFVVLLVPRIFEDGMEHYPFDIDIGASSATDDVLEF